MAMQHACGQCGKIFDKEQDYLTHRCQQTPVANPPQISESDILAAVKASRQKKKGRG